MIFRDRKEAGKALAGELLEYQGREEAIVLAIPRGGIAVAYETSKILGLPLDILVIKKIGHPENDELALGAAGLNSFFLNAEVARGVSEYYIHRQVGLKQKEVKERYLFLRGKKPIYHIKDRIVIIVDDGIATGATMKMAIEIIRKQHPKKIVIAVPVAPPLTVRELNGMADEVVCLSQPGYFMAIGEFYSDFSQVTDLEAKRMLKEAEKWKEHRQSEALYTYQ